MIAARALTEAVQDAVARGSVRVVSEFRRGSLSQSYREDETLDRGRQLIQFGAVHAEVIEIGDRAFIGGNGAAMVGYFGLPKRDRSQLAGHWASLTPKDPDFKTVVRDVTLRSDIGDLIPTGVLTRSSTTSNGRPVTVITGSPPADQHPPAGSRIMLYVSEGPIPLPIRETIRAPDGTTGTIVLSHWGEQVTTTAPPHATPISKIDPSL
jgi:hypothetical protein